MQLINKLRGRKTYVVAVVSALSGVVTALHGGHPFEAASLVLGGSLGASLRAAVAKAHADVKAVLAAVKTAEAAVKKA